MGHTLIETRELTKDYHLGGQAVHALRHVTVKIHASEFVAVMPGSSLPSRLRAETTTL